jgi:hypothetical protein
MKSIGKATEFVSKAVGALRRGEARKRRRALRTPAFRRSAPTALLTNSVALPMLFMAVAVCSVGELNRGYR